MLPRHSTLNHARRSLMTPHQRGYIEARYDAVLYRPAAIDHDPVGAMRPAQHQRGERIAVAGETQFVELEQRQIGALADRDLAELGPADAGRRALGRPAQRILVADLA